MAIISFRPLVITNSTINIIFVFPVIYDVGWEDILVTVNISIKDIRVKDAIKAIPYQSINFAIFCLNRYSFTFWFMPLKIENFLANKDSKYCTQNT